MADAAPPSAPRRDRWRLRLVAGAFFAALVALAVWVLSTGEPPGEVFFTGLDDSAQTALARSLANGAPLVFRDEAFAAVPPEVRSDLLYRPGLPRKTRDLAHQIDLRTMEARPFFQPFLPWQRAHLPRLPFALALGILALAMGWVGFGSGWRQPNLPWLLQGIGLALAALFLVPWVPLFAFDPYAEGPATLLAGFALALAFVAGEGARPAIGAIEGLCLGLAVCFHPTLAAYAVPIGLFAVLRRGAWRHTLALALGALAGLAPLVWSTLRVAAPYGNFLSPATLRAMISASPDIRALALALAAAAPLGLAGVALAHAPRLRAAAARPRARTAIAAACGAAILLAPALAWLHPAAHRALLADRGSVLPALPPLAMALALALFARRPATCALLAGCAAAALPFLVIQGQEVHVGLWSLRRSLPPVLLLSLAALFGAFEVTDGERASRDRFVRFAKARRALSLLALFCTLAAVAVRRPALPGGDDVRAFKKVWLVEAAMEPDGLYLFDYFPFAAPFAGAHPERAIFGINEGVAKALDHGRVVGWLRDECEKRPTYVVAGTREHAPTVHPRRKLLTTVLEDRLALENEKDKWVSGGVKWPLDFLFLRARPPRRGDGTTIEFNHSPFGLATGWDALRPGKKGRWARQGATFWGPVPEPGGAVRFEILADWTPPKGADWPVQKVRLIPPWTGEPLELEVKAEPSGLRPWLNGTIRRPADDTADLPPSALWRISADRTYDPAAFGARGYPPDLVAVFHLLRATVP